MIAGKVFPPPPVKIDVTTTTDKPFSLKKVIDCTHHDFYNLVFVSSG